MLCCYMKELVLIIVVLILFVIRIGVILNSWDRFSHGQESTLCILTVFSYTYRPVCFTRKDVDGLTLFGKLKRHQCLFSRSVRYSVSRFVAMEANYGRTSGRSLGVRRTSRTSDKSSSWIGNHRVKRTNHGQRWFDLLKICGKESGVNIFLVRMETGHVKRTGVVDDIGGNNRSSDLGQIQPWSGDHSLNSRGFQLHVPSGEWEQIMEVPVAAPWE